MPTALVVLVMTALVMTTIKFSAALRCAGLKGDVCRLLVRLSRLRIAALEALQRMSNWHVPMISAVEAEELLGHGSMTPPSGAGCRKRPRSTWEKCV